MTKDEMDQEYDTKVSKLDEQQGKLLSNYDLLYPGLGKAMVSLAASPIYGRMDSVLDAFRNEKSAATGRGAAKTEDELDEDRPQFYLRPNGEKYYTRPWGKHVDVEVIRKSHKLNHFMLLYGPPGCGKTAVVDASLENLITLIGSGDTEVADLVGGFIMLDDGSFEWVDGPLIVAAEKGLPFLIDEIGLIDPKVLSIVYGLMDGRREYTVTANPNRGTVKAADGFYVIAATNPNAPGVNLSEALLSRFTIHVEMTTDWALVGSLGVCEEFVTVGQNLNTNMATGDISWAPQFRDGLAFRDLEEAFGQDFAISNMIASAPERDRDTVAGTVHRVFGKEYRPARI